MNKKYLIITSVLITPATLALVSCSSNKDNPQKLSLKKTSFEANELGITSIIDQFNINNEWIFNKKHLLFNNETLIGNPQDIKDVNSSKQNNNLIVTFLYLNSSFEFRINNFHIEDQAKPPTQQKIHLIKSIFEANEFNLQDQYVSNFNPTKNWLFSNKLKLFKNPEALTKEDEIIDVSKKPEANKIKITFSIFSKNFEIDILNFKIPENGISLKSKNFDAQYLSLDSKKAPWQINISSSFLWYFKKSIFNNSKLITQSTDIQNIVSINDGIKGEKKVSFDLKGQNFSFTISNFSKSLSLIESPSENIYQSGNKLNMFGTYLRKIISNYERTAKKEEYETELIKNDSNFKYPGYNNDYKSQANLARQVMAERVDFNGSKVKYNNPNWIQNEIKNNRFKKHPAAKSFFVQQKENNEYVDKAKAIEAQYQISTSKTGVIPLGLYAPPGEVITLTLDDETIEFFKKINHRSLSIVINTNFWDNAEVGQQGSVSKRYPFVETTFNLDTNNKTIQFGTPFGGSIAIKINHSLDSWEENDFSMIKIKFKIKDAIESFFYIHGVTTKEDWEEQIKKIKEKKIASPIFSAYFTLGGLNVQFSDEETIGTIIKATDIEYPYDVFEKWFQFLSLSHYYGRRNHILNAKYCDDILNGLANASGDSANMPIAWSSAFLTGMKGFDSIKNSWGIFHEINHLYDETKALFKKREHWDTNQTTTSILSLLLDTGRWRSPVNITSEFTKQGDQGWTRLGNSFSNIFHQNDKNDYRLFVSLLYTIGTYNFMNYVRWDAINHPNTNDNWEGLDEIRVLSNFFKLNFWPTFNEYDASYNDWLKNESMANDNQKEMIKEMSQFPAIDFVGNLYATGIYIYDSVKKDFVYTNDVISPYEIPAGQDYTFDFEKYINSTNKSFNWENLEFTSSKTRAELAKDPTNPKKLIYKPNKNKIEEIDEFDISITPTKWSGRVDNYVPKYKWKMKIRQVVNRPILKIYKYNNLSRNNDDFDKNLIDKMEKEGDENIIYKGLTKITSSSSEYIVNKSQFNDFYTFGIKIEYDFIVPEEPNDQKVHFLFKSNFYNNYLKMVVKNISDASNETMNGTNQSITEYTDISIKAKKGDILNVSLYISTKNTNDVNYSLITKFNDKSIDPSKNVLIPNIKNIKSNGTIDDILTNKKYQYQNRKLDYFKFNGGFAEIYNPNYSGYKKYNEYEENEFDLIYDKNLNNNASIYTGEINNLKNISNSKQVGIFSSSAIIDIDLKTKSDLSSIVFKNKTDQNSYASPTNLKIAILDDDKNEIETIYQGAYIEKRPLEKNIVNFSKIYKTRLIRIYLSNQVENSIELTSIIPCKMPYSQYNQLNNFISTIDNSSITYIGDWTKTINDFDKNISDLNNASMFSNKQNDSMEFTIDSTGFDIVGQKNTNGSSFDVYINDKLVQNVSTQNDGRIDNAILFSYINSSNDKEIIKIKIIHKDNNPLYINFFSTRGFNIKYV